MTFHLSPQRRLQRRLGDGADAALTPRKSPRPSAKMSCQQIDLCQSYSDLRWSPILIWLPGHGKMRWGPDAPKNVTLPSPRLNLLGTWGVGVGVIIFWRGSWQLSWHLVPLQWPQTSRRSASATTNMFCEIAEWCWWNILESDILEMESDLKPEVITYSWCWIILWSWRCSNVSTHHII